MMLIDRVREWKYRKHAAGIPELTEEQIGAIYEKLKDHYESIVHSDFSIYYRWVAKARPEWRLSKRIFYSYIKHGMPLN